MSRTLPHIYEHVHNMFFAAYFILLKNYLRQVAIKLLKLRMRIENRVNGIKRPCLKRVMKKYVDPLDTAQCHLLFVPPQSISI